MGRLAIARAILLATMIPVLTAQEKRPTDQKYDVKRCTPRVVSHAPRPKQVSIRTRAREKSTGFPPVIAFQILESGEVSDTHVERGSGIADIDAHALNWIQGTKYNPRPGCGVIESKATVLIHWVSSD